MGNCLKKEPVVSNHNNPPSTPKSNDKATESSTHVTTNTKQASPVSTPRKNTATPNGPETTNNQTQKSTKNATPKQPKEEGFSKKKLEKLFSEFKDGDADDENNEQMGGEAIEKFCNEIDIDPEDPVLLALSYHLNASEMGCFYRDEFINGFEKLKLDSIEGIKNYVPTLRKELDNQATLKPIYKYVFELGKNEPEQKCIEVDMAVGLLNLLLSNRYVHAKNFVEYLGQQTSTRAINLDQWTNLLEFCATVSEDCSNYDESAAWPTLLDEYVQWLQNGRKLLTSSQQGW
eukprot:TRINITY_DN6949_c0_g1_i4.p1 TRINITY_DN6949_c0_g1~~TRINITY_DN6949_c0_g1_i4.p1  ORF type:complete len:289 (-),score=59.15 TRINITY_DN6949_c0_g1_i4:169-1035(-)